MNSYESSLAKDHRNWMFSQQNREEGCVQTHYSVARLEFFSKIANRLWNKTLIYWKAIHLPGLSINKTILSSLRTLREGFLCAL